MIEINRVRYSYLKEQFSDCDDLWAELKNFVATGDFTLGKPLKKFEDSFADLIGTKYAVGVNSGTDAIKIALKALDIRPGDEVITTANTFVATVGAITEIGAKVIFVDCNSTFCMDTKKLEQAVTDKTRAIVPVHFAGYMTDMREVMKIAEKYSLVVVEDSCQAMLGSIDGRKSGTWGNAGAFSLHPLKNLNVWADGGVIVTSDQELNRKIRLLRNHGLSDRDTVAIMGYNSRLDTFQAVVANWLMPTIHKITESRIQNAKFYDKSFSALSQIKIPNRPDAHRIVYHLYMLFAENRDELLKYCNSHGDEAKIHYPVPI